MGLLSLPGLPATTSTCAYTQLDAGSFRYPARFRRWRADREPRSCRFDQLE